MVKTFISFEGVTGGDGNGELVCKYCWCCSWKGGSSSSAGGEGNSKWFESCVELPFDIERVEVFIFIGLVCFSVCFSSVKFKMGLEHLLEEFYHAKDRLKELEDIVNEYKDKIEDEMDKERLEYLDLL